MSRIGRKPINIPAGVTVTINDGVIEVKGPKGTLDLNYNPAMTVEVQGEEIVVTRPNDEKTNRSLHGLTRTLIANMIVGVTEGYKKEMELVGVGYRVSNEGNVMEFSLGYTHPIFLQLPPEIKVETKSERNKNPYICLESCDKQLLGQVCAKIRSFRMPEPYKGKGILYIGEQIRRKSGKAAGAK